MIKLEHSELCFYKEIINLDKEKYCCYFESIQVFKNGWQTSEKNTKVYFDGTCRVMCDHFVWRWYCVLKTFWEFLISFWLKTRRVASKSLVCVCVCLVSCAKAKLIGIQIRFGAVFNVNYSNLCDFNHRSCLSIVSLLGLHGAYDQFFVTVAVFMQAHN